MIHLVILLSAQNDETGEIERLMGKVSIPEDTWVSPHEGEDWDLGRLHYIHDCCQVL